MFVAAVRAVAGLVPLATVLVGRARPPHLIADSARQPREARGRPAAPASGGQEMAAETDGNQRAAIFWLPASLG